MILIMSTRFKTKISCIKHFHVNKKKKKKKVTTTNEDKIWCILFIPLNLWTRSIPSTTQIRESADVMRNNEKMNGQYTTSLLKKLIGGCGKFMCELVW